MIELRNTHGTQVWLRIEDQDDGYDYAYDPDRQRPAKPARPASAVAAAPAVKRPRGRPRKHPLVPAVVAEPAEASS
jgi:hypothetical protein